MEEVTKMAEKYIWDIQKGRKIKLSSIKSFFLFQSGKIFQARARLTNEDFITLAEFDTPLLAQEFIDKLTD